MNISRCGRVMAVVLSGLLAAGAAHAVYRCGNVYQDRPCDDNGPQPHLTPGMKAPRSPAASPAATASPFAPACARVGEQAQKVAWKREAGATQDKQLAETGAGSRAVVESVYRKRGSAPEIRAAVEAECLAEKQKEADDAAALKLLLQSRQGAAPTAPAEAIAPAAPSPANAGKTAAPAGPSPSCAGWRAELDAINAGFRKGGSAATMEQLQNSRRAVEQSLRAGRC